MADLQKQPSVESFRRRLEALEDSHRFHKHLGVDLTSRLTDISGARAQIITIGKEERTVAIGESIQKEIDALGTNGGIIRLRAGTHTVTTNITVPNSTQIIGENTDTTIIDFNSTSAQFVVAGTDAYTTGTISSIGSGGTAVVGSSTAWNTNNNVTTAHQMFIDNRWYRIASVNSDTSITLAEPYKDAGTFSGAYRAVVVKADIEFKEMTIKNSTAQAIDFDDVRDIDLEAITFLSNSKGFTMDNAAFVVGKALLVVNSTSNGYELTNASFFIANPIAVSGNGGHGVVLNNIKSCAWVFSASNGNTTDGFNCTDVINCAITAEASGNGGQGIELVSGCNQNRISTTNIEANTSDGVKITATSDNNVVSTSVLKDNGGYGLNIAASTCDNTVVIGNLFNGNATAATNDAGTGTIFRGNIGVTDNSTSALTQSLFGGDGSDGALSITSMTTTIDLLGATTLEKNYTSISITGTGKLAFSNPHANGTIITLRSQGNVTLTSSGSPNIDFSSLGADGGAAVVGAGDGNDGEDGIWYVSSDHGNGGQTATVGAGGTAPHTTAQEARARRRVPNMFLIPGAGGGSGFSIAGETSGAGGKGAGSAIIECAGALNFTGTIHAKGGDGGDGTDNGNGVVGGGGGGGGGMVYIAAVSITAQSGTFTVTGGLKGDGTASGGNPDRGGGGGSSGQTDGTSGSGKDGGAGANGIGAVIG
jgi:hypothetical protein